MKKIFLIPALLFSCMLYAQKKCQGNQAVSADFTWENIDCSIFLFEGWKDTIIKKKFYWSFGDGTFSDKPKTEHAYQENGVYNVQLIVASINNCRDTIVKQVIVNKPKADFTYKQDQPGNVQFNTQKTKLTYSWNFGDGNSSKDPSGPKHIYKKSGIYNVTLMVQNDAGCIDIIEKPISIDLPANMPPLPVVKVQGLIEPEKRITSPVKEIFINEDSISVSLYDNGEIDGDSVSIFFNNKLVKANQLLSSKPVTFTLKFDNASDTNILVMFADNLGAIPPNTALMVITDGKNRYEVNVSSTKTTNGAIVFRKRR